MRKKDITLLYERGLISSKPYQYFEISDKMNQYMAEGITKTEAIVRTRKLLNCSERTIYKALKATAGIVLE